MKVKLWILKIKAIRSEKLNLIDKLLITGKNHLSLSLKKKNLQLNRGLTSPLDSGSSSMSFLSLFFNDELLEDITFQTNVYNTASANNEETKPAQPLKVDELKKVFCVILFMDIEKFPNRRLYWKSFTLSKFIAEPTYHLTGLRKFYQYCILMTKVYRNLLEIQITSHCSN